MEKWEYWTRFVYANIDNEGAKELLAKRFPNRTTQWEIYAPQTMAPILNKLGEDGWELVHMEPVSAVGSNGDVGFQHGGSASFTTWSNVYFCVFKRKIET